MGSVYKLSTEFPRDHGGGVQALAALSDNVLVSGANDGTVCVWARGSDGRCFANVHLSVSDHAGMIRAVFALPACGLCPEGGFATGCLDKLVRVFTYSPSTHAVACVATLAGHTGGVDSLGLTSQGHLLSGGRDGQARVWDLATGACLQAMAGHENSVRVCGLVGGAIVTSSTGRKSEEGLHVDYKLRLWKCTSGVGGKPAWALERTIEDHAQAIQDLGGMPGGEGFVSSGNDGTLRVRDAQGNPLQCITVPPTPTGEPVYVYKGRLLPATMWLAGCCEDSMLRLWCMDTLPATADAIALPGTPWGVVGLSNGDIAVSCTHAASGTIGHVYVFTQDAARGASQAELATFAADLVPPARSSEGSSSSSSSSSGAQKVHISGPYSARQSTPPGATALGGYGFFRMPSGGIWVSTWSGTAWDDVGEAQGLEGDDGWAGGGGGGGDSGGFDYSQNVEIELQSGMAKVPLRWNDGDDLDDVAEAFCKANGVPMRNSGQVRTFMVQTMAQQGVGPGGRKKEAEALAAAAAAAARPPTLAARLGLTLIPSMAYVETSAVDWKKLLAKLSELNATVGAAGGSPVTAEEEAWLRDAAATLADTSRYHSSRVPPASLAALNAKVLHWPLSHMLPAMDFLRVCVTHPSGAEACAAMPAFLPALLRVCTGAGEGERPAALLAARTLYNACKAQATRRALLQAPGALTGTTLPAVAALLRFPHASVAVGGSVVLHNVARALVEGPPPPAQAVAAVLGVLGAALGGEGGEEDVRLNALLALGTLLCSDAEGGKVWLGAAQAAGLEGSVAALMQGKTEAAAREVLRVMQLQ